MRIEPRTAVLLVGLDYVYKLMPMNNIYIYIKVILARTLQIAICTSKVECGNQIPIRNCCSHSTFQSQIVICRVQKSIPINDKFLCLLGAHFGGYTVLHCLCLLHYKSGPQGGMVMRL